MERKKILIVGGGLAGTTLAHRFLNHGCDVTILDKGENHATAIAAGMVNPMVFRRMNKSWRLDEFIFEAQKFYRSLEIKLDHKLFHPITIRRMFSSTQERDSWEGKEKLREFKDFLEVISENDKHFNQAKNEFGSGRLKNSFWIDAKTYYDANLAYFDKHTTFLKEVFSLNDFNPEQAVYKGKKYDHVVFCCGYLNKYIPFFENAPIQQTKGQTLTISSNEIIKDESLNRKCFILPIGDDKFRIGATYEWNDESLKITEESKDLLLENLKVIGDYNINILEQSAGIRPTVLDRRPIMGQHTTYKKLFIFNGLGTKGYLMAPTLSREMCDFILQEKALDKEVSLGRFSS